MANIKKSSELAKEFLLKQGMKVQSFEDLLELIHFKERRIHVYTDVTSDLAEYIHTMVELFNSIDEENEVPIEEREPIKIYIDTPGGDLYACFSIIDSIQLSKTPIITINISSACSAGFYIFLAADRRIALPNSVFLFHEGSTSFWGDSNKFNNHADFYKKNLARMKNYLIERTNLDEEWYEKNSKDDVWMMAEEALEKNICTEIMKKETKLN
jgi:ATP-dependent Clp protease protease subunit